VPDKGLDRVFVFRLDRAAGKLVTLPDATMATRESAGPRHIAFHPRNAWAYVINELDSTINACAFDARTGGLAPLQRISSLPDTFVGDSRAAEIEVSPDGRFVFASNRGHDSVGTFAVDPRSGRLSPTGWQASGGATPRFIAVAPDAKSLLVANEDGDDIRELAIDAETGRLEAGRVVAKTGSPVCIVFRRIDRVPR
jgi:6-phosphogluconolactonase (cycloisomerase 2 family)